mmetsp:Transcript_44627/g.126173  ORF Transcript_44627/g.126173 Transcript_44627/m.126173 type:complete len:268 (+) Transcript_44627:1-804(+)
MKSTDMHRQGRALRRAALPTPTSGPRPRRRLSRRATAQGEHAAVEQQSLRRGTLRRSTLRRGTLLLRLLRFFCGFHPAGLFPDDFQFLPHHLEALCQHDLAQIAEIVVVYPELLQLRCGAGGQGAHQFLDAGVLDVVVREIKLGHILVPLEVLHEYCHILVGGLHEAQSDALDAGFHALLPAFAADHLPVDVRFVSRGLHLVQVASRRVVLAILRPLLCVPRWSLDVVVVLRSLVHALVEILVHLVLRMGLFRLGRDEAFGRALWWV